MFDKPDLANSLQIGSQVTCLQVKNLFKGVAVVSKACSTAVSYLPALCDDTGLFIERSLRASRQVSALRVYDLLITFTRRRDQYELQDSRRASPASSNACKSQVLLEDEQRCCGVERCMMMLAPFHLLTLTNTFPP